MPAEEDLAQQCVGKARETCLNDPACHWSGSSCTIGDGAPPSDGTKLGKTPVLYSCSVEGAPNTVEGLTWVDSVKAKAGTAGSIVEGVARSKAGVPSTAGATCSIHVQPKHDEKEWIHRRMASNCAPRYDMADITTINHFQCYYEGTGVIDGKRVRRPFYHIDGRLASCDGYNEYMETSDEVMESVKLYAYHKAGGKEAQMDPDKFVCMVQSLPHT